MAPRETETMLMQNFGATNKEHLVCYGIFWGGQFILCNTTRIA